MAWEEEARDSRSVTAPLSLIITAFAPADAIENTWTPQLRTDVAGETELRQRQAAPWWFLLGTGIPAAGR